MPLCCSGHSEKRLHYYKVGTELQNFPTVVGRYLGFSTTTSAMTEEAVGRGVGGRLGSSCCKASLRHDLSTCYLLTLLFPECLLFLM